MHRSDSKPHAVWTRNERFSYWHKPKRSTYGKRTHLKYPQRLWHISNWQERAKMYYQHRHIYLYIFSHMCAIGSKAIVWAKATNHPIHWNGRYCMTETEKIFERRLNCTTAAFKYIKTKANEQKKTHTHSNTKTQREREIWDV